MAFPHLPPTLVSAIVNTTNCASQWLLACLYMWATVEEIRILDERLEECDQRVREVAHTGAAAVRSTERGRWQPGQVALPSAQPSRYSPMHTCTQNEGISTWRMQMDGHRTQQAAQKIRHDWICSFSATKSLTDL